MYRPISRLLARAPLLPLSSLGSSPDHPLFREAVASLPPTAERALSRYARRAAFRATPHGLFAGVLLGSLGERTRIATGTARAHRFVSWARARADARASLDDAAVRDESRLRAAPTVVADERQVRWLALVEGAQAEWREAALDETLARVLAATRKWARFSRLRALVPDGDADDYLMMLVDDGLLVSDREPPLVGPAPAGEPDAALLTFDGACTVSREAIERAARVAPILFRLQHALSPPAAERELQSTAAFETIAEVFGAGAIDLGALLLGEYGVTFDDEWVRQIAAPPPALLELLLSRAHLDEARFSVEELDRVLPSVALPPTCELFLQPTRDDSGRGWLLGLHAPAGATWGRFAHALGSSLLDELAAAEPRGRLDVAFTPSPELADLCAHPPAREAALALIGWPENAVTLAELELSLPLMLHRSKNRVAPSPLFRVRSTTAPPGVARLLVGWSLFRQHAPWAMPLGILAALPRTPRVTIDGFVVSPRSWRLPSSELPARVQVGHEDELLLVSAPDDFAGHDRAWEVWPPLEEVVDDAGRRVELVAALVDDEESVDYPGAVPAPRRAPPARDWHTFKIFGAADRADAVLVGAVAPLVERLRAPWFFLRYVEDARPHLRVRVRARDFAKLVERVEAALAPARAAGDVVSVEIGDYFREQARYGRALDAAERVFQSDSELALAVLGEGSELDTLERCVLSLDALAGGLGLSLAARRELAAARRIAYEPELPDARALAGEYRARQGRLMGLLGAPPDYFAAHKKRLRKCAGARSALPALLHLACNRMAPDEEARAFYFWDRALESLTQARRR